MPAITDIQNHISSKKKVLLMFDYDGTLTPIVDTPDLAVLKPAIKESLVKLSNLENVKLALISGRSINQIQKLTSIEHQDIEMYGLHGGEMIENGKIFVNVSEKCKNQIKDLKAKVKHLTNLDGIIIEDKEYSLSLHYRMANSTDTQYSINEFKNSVNELKLLEDFRYQEGKMVVEVLPANFNKAKVVNYLLNKYPQHMPVYFGDDKTDIFAFKEVKKHNGLAIVVGNKELFQADGFTSVDGVYEFIDSVVGNNIKLS